MLDIRWIRDHPVEFDRALASRGMDPLSDRLIAPDEARRGAIQRLQDAQQRRNTSSKAIGKAKGAGDEAEAQRLMAEVADLKAQIQQGEEAERAADAEIQAILAATPNVPFDDVPNGADEAANVEVRRDGTPLAPDFEPKEHYELGEALGMMDFETAAKLAGSRFVILKGQLARLERALGQFMLDMHVSEHGYTEVQPPMLVRDPALFGTAQLPKFAEDQFATTDGRWLIPTAEVPLTNLVRESLVDEAELPLRVTALTPCFRSEAGSAGRDTRGMLRQHQFNKVELVSVTTPEKAVEEHERMTSCAETVLRRLGLHYRLITLCTGDMGFSARKTYDIEVWLPGQGAYREISSCSVCGDFQARRMDARYRPAEGGSTRFVHTLNGSGVAVGRALIAIMETYQQADGSIAVPDALRPYMGGIDTIQTA